MKKFELIREIFSIVERCGKEDNKLDEICGYTKDKFENPVYVRKLEVKTVDGVDSVAITSMDEKFEDSCDSDLRIAFNDKNIGQRVFIWANEADMDMLMLIHAELVEKYGVNEEHLHYIKAIKFLEEKGVDIGECKSLGYVFSTYNKYITKKYGW